MNWKAYLIESLGAFAITFFGAYSRIQNQGDISAIALTYFMVVFATTHAFHYLSGAHFNPTLTVCLWLTKHISPSDALHYISAQILGSLVAGLGLYISIDRTAAGKRTYYGHPQLYESQKYMAASLDMLSVFLLVYVAASILANTKYQRVYAASIAAVYLVNMLAFGVISGGCLNLVETIGPGLVGLSFKYWPYYLVAHLLGGLGAIGLYTQLIGYDPLHNALEEDNEEETSDEHRKAD